jgi:polysaccharide pyruvyl transferase WcaK-like protein
VTGYAQLPLLARALGLDFHMFGVGVGPLGHDDARRLVQFVASIASSLAVRDEASRQLVDSSGGSGSRIACYPDPVFALDLARRSVPEQVERLAREWRILAVNLRHWELGAGPTLGERLARALGDIVARHEGVALLGIPMQGGENRDEQALRDVFDRVPMPGSHPKIVLPWTPRLDELLGALSTCDALVAMRLHACLLAHRLGKPVLGIDYDPKIREHFAQVGAASRVIALDTPVARIVEALDAILSRSPSPPMAASRAKIEELERETRRGIEELAGRLSASPARHRSTAAWPAASGAARRQSRPARSATDGDARPDTDGDQMRKQGAALAQRLAFRWPYWRQDGRLSPLWHMPRGVAVQRTPEAPQSLRVVAEGSGAFYLSAAGGGFARPPSDIAAWAVAGGALGHVQLEVAIETDGLEVALWIIEYSRDSRVCHTQRTLRSGLTQVTWITSPSTQSIRPAIRFKGGGAAILGPIGFAQDGVDTADGVA